jgi:hypothetical protein
MALFPSGPDVQGATKRGGASGNSPWVGWIIFGALLMVLLGSLHAFHGLVALLNSDSYSVPEDGLTVQLSYTAWGWLQLIFGGIVVAAGIALFLGQRWARVVAVIVAFLSVLVNVGFGSAAPVWSAIMVGIDVLVIWAVVVHGEEIENF